MRHVGTRQAIRSSTEIEQMDLDIVQRAQNRLGLERVELLHPSLMYRLLRFYWFDKAGVGVFKHHTDYRRLAAVERSARLKDLPGRVHRREVLFPAIIS